MNIKITVESTIDKESDVSQDGILCKDGLAIEFHSLEYLIERIERYLPSSAEYPDGVRIVKLNPADHRGEWGIEKIEDKIREEKRRQDN